MFDVIRIPAFKDNYIWLLRKGGAAVVVDPGDAKPVMEILDAEGLTLSAIFVTHHHNDHQGGVGELTARFPVDVFGPAVESITGLTHPLSGGETIRLDSIDAQFSVMSVPGHTLGHLAYYSTPHLFCGDTLFAGGCGRLFEGSPAQMFDSLARIMSLPGETEVFCAHEYTQANLHFASAVEPGNIRLQARVAEVAEARANGLPTVPSSIADEKATNPFLRCAVPEVIASAQIRSPGVQAPVDVFAALRLWRNNF